MSCSAFGSLEARSNSFIKLNEPSPSTLKLSSLARKQARELARAYSFKIESSLPNTRLGYTPIANVIKNNITS